MHVCGHHDLCAETGPLHPRLEVAPDFKTVWLESAGLGPIAAPGGTKLCKTGGLLAPG